MEFSILRYPKVDNYTSPNFSVYSMNIFRSPSLSKSSKEISKTVLFSTFSFGPISIISDFCSFDPSTSTTMTNLPTLGALPSFTTTVSTLSLPSDVAFIPKSSTLTNSFTRRSEVGALLISSLPFDYTQPTSTIGAINTFERNHRLFISTIAMLPSKINLKEFLSQYLYNSTTPLTPYVKSFRTRLKK